MNGKKARSIRNMAKSMAKHNELPEYQENNWSVPVFQNIGSQNMPYFMKVQSGTPRHLSKSERGLYLQFKRNYIKAKSKAA